MEQYIGCDMHKRYSVFVAVDGAGGTSPPVRVENDRESLRRFLEGLEPGRPIAVETTGNWYWFLEEIERAGHIALLTHAGKAKLMMGQLNKTDKLDARGLAVLLRNGTLPTVWIPPRNLRDQRELLRLRMALVNMSTRLKNRVHAILAKQGVTIEEVTDIFSHRGRALVHACQEQLPQETGRCLHQQLLLLEELEKHIQEAEKRIRQVIRETEEMRLLMTIPGVGPILGSVIALEVGDVERFPGPEHLASYAGTVPRVHASGGRTRYGRTRPDVNRYLKWAFVEAANVIARHRKAFRGRHVARLYERVRQRKGHSRAAIAVARHLAEATYWILRSKEPYREANDNRLSSGTGKRGATIARSRL